jgi:hypothetical protein
MAEAQRMRTIIEDMGFTLERLPVYPEFIGRKYIKTIFAQAGKMPWTSRVTSLPRRYTMEHTKRLSNGLKKTEPD